MGLRAPGYGEHARRYDHLAERLVNDGAVVYAPDHFGHGRSQGERALVSDVDQLSTDLGRVRELAASEHPGLPLVLIGHSMGGLIATYYAQRHGDGLAALVISAPAIGRNPDIEALIEMDPLPDVPIDPDVLSRDPAVGRAYAEDPLVYHGPFRRETLQAFGAALQAVERSRERLPEGERSRQDEERVEPEEGESHVAPRGAGAPSAAGPGGER